MTSKQSQAKTEQGYIKKPTWPVCGNCANYTSESVTEPSAFGFGEWAREINVRCTIGGFKVGKLGTCKRHTEKERKGDERLGNTSR